MVPSADLSKQFSCHHVLFHPSKTLQIGRKTDSINILTAEAEAVAEL